MEQILDAPVQAERRLEYAGFWIRVAAYILDTMIVYFALFLFAFVIGGGGSLFGYLSGDEGAVLGLGFGLGFLVLVIVYYAGMESSSRQATLGKMAVGIKVGNMRGEQISFANAIGRLFAKVISGMILYIGFMMIGWDDKKQGLHDRIADTVVYYK
jgi:uncharacterized RDD family membrane protein YckC